MGAPRIVVFALALAATGCQAGPRPLVAGTDVCEFCRMTVADPRFGGEVITRNGRLQTFDAVECLVSYYVAAPEGEVRSVWVAEQDSATLVPADSARFLRGGIRSPMGRDLAAFSPRRTPDELQRTYGGEVLTWSQLVAEARKRADGEGVRP